MDENLQSLINYYEGEQSLLQTLLDKCLREENYKYAKYYLKNLQHLQKTLFNLYSLADATYAEKNKISQLISNIMSIKEECNDKSMANFCEKTLKEFKTKLSALNEIPLVEPEEKHDIENSIIRLAEKNINGFQLILKEADLFLDFTLAQPDVIRIELTPFNALHKSSFDSLFHDSEIKSLKKNGFKLSDNQNNFYINFNLKNQSTRSLNIFLAYVFFEILHWHSRKNSELLIY